MNGLVVRAAGAALVSVAMAGLAAGLVVAGFCGWQLHAAARRFELSALDVAFSGSTLAAEAGALTLFGAEFLCPEAGVQNAVSHFSGQTC